MYCESDYRRGGPWVAGNLHVVSGLGREHNSPMEWMNQGLPRGQVQDEDSSKVEVKVEIEVRSEV